MRSLDFCFVFSCGFISVTAFWTIHRPNMVYISVSCLSILLYVVSLLLMAFLFYCFADNAYGVHVSSHIFPARIRESLISSSVVSMSAFFIRIWFKRHFFFTCLRYIHLSWILLLHDGFTSHMVCSYSCIRSASLSLSCESVLTLLSFPEILWPFF